MIREATERDLEALSCDDPFFTRVRSLFESYGEGYDFVGFWAQENDTSVTTLISRFEDKFSLYLTKDSETEEIEAFLSFQGAGAVMFDGKFALELTAKNEISGQVLRYKGEEYISDIELYEPEIKDIYSLLCTCESEIFRVPPYLSFLSDVTHRKNKGKCQMLGAKVDGELASFVMTVSETEKAVIIGAVSTHPNYRKRGLSRKVVRAMATKSTKENKAVYVFSASEENTRFYQNSGFETVAEFREIFLNF